MTEPRPDDGALPKSDVDTPGIRDVIEDILDGPDDPATTPAAPAAPADPPPTGGGVFGGAAIGGLAGSAAGGLLKGLLVDRDKDGIIDVFEPGNVTQARNDATVEDFLTGALAQIGDKYQRGVENRFDNADPSKWDGSELVEWAANRAGVQLKDGPTQQYRQMVGKGGGLDIDDALHTPGAILYEFNGDPINGSPSRASTAISLGDGRVLEIDPKEGVRIVDAKGMHFTHAAVIPGLTDAHEPGAGALDVVHQALVQHGIEEAAPPVEDTPEIAALGARAAELRAKFVDTSYGDGRAERLQHRSDLERDQKLAEAGLKMTNDEAVKRQQEADAKVEDVSKLNAQADAAEARGDRSAAQELREEASSKLALAQSDQSAADHAKVEASKYQQQIDAAKTEIGRIDEGKTDRQQLNFTGEQALDELENKVTLMRAANAQAALVTDLERRESEARAAGNTAQADQLAKQVQSARTTAERMQQSADAVTVDETTLQQIQDLPAAAGGPAPVQTPTPAPAGDTTPDATPDTTPDKAPEAPPEGTETTPSPSGTGAQQQTVPDTQEIADLAQRAAHLRAQELTAIRHELVEREQEYQGVYREHLQADSLTEYNQAQIDKRRTDVQEAQARADADEKAARDAEANGNSLEAEESREHAAKMLLVVHAGEENIAKFSADLEASKAKSAEFKERADKLEAAYKTRIDDVNKAEDAIDAMENRTRAMRAVSTETTLAADLDKQAAAAGSAGNATEAQRLADEAATHRTAAQTAQTQLDAITVDEGALKVLDGVDVTTQPPLGSPPPASSPDQPGTSDTSTPDATEATGTSDAGGDLVGDIDPVAPSAPAATSAEASTAVDDPAAVAADGSTAPDLSADTTAPADASAGTVAESSFEDPSAGTQDFAAPTEPAPVADSSLDDEA